MSIFIQTCFMKQIIIIVACFFLLTNFYVKHPIERVWFNAEKTSKIQVYLAVDGKYYGKIVWLATPNDVNGQPRLDAKNEEKKLRNRPVLGLAILWAFNKTANEENEFSGGKVYDPNSGKTYCGKIVFENNQLKLRGYLCSLGKMFGRSSTWTPAD
jgi:uncharacterized protein (DUF2147 family)